MIRVLCLVLMLFAFAAPQARAGELEDLIDKHFAWRGGAAYERLQSVRLEADLKAAGLTGTTNEWRERSGRSRDEYDLGGAVKGSSAIAEDAWSEASGVVEPMPANNARDNRRLNSLEFGDALRGKGGAKASLLGTEARDGKQWRVVRVSFGDADTYDAFLDPATGALLGYRIVEDRRERFLRLDDWRMVDGVRIPFFREQTDDNPNAKATVVVRKAALNEMFDAAIYARPAARRIATFAGGAKSTGPIKFDFFNGARIYIPVTIRGRQVKVLLDSGAETTVLDKGFADAMGIKYTGKAIAQGTGGATDAWFAEDVVMQIGNMTLENRNVGVIDMADVSKRLGIPLPVVLGEDVFKQLIVDIDFDKAEIAFHDPAAFKAPAGAVAVPVIANEGGIRSVAVEVEGQAPIQVDFDLGNGSYFSLDPAFYEKHGLLENRPQSKILGGAVGGAREERIALVKSLRFAGVEFKDVPTTFTTPSKTNQVGSERQPGNVGLSILARFRLITDYGHDRLYLVARKDTASRPFRKDRAGLQTVLEGERLKVTYASPGSPAEAAGWKAGEEITAIDGRPVTAAYNGSELSRWRFGPAGKTVSLTLADGSTRTLTLKDYF